MKFNHTPIKLFFTLSVLITCNNAFALCSGIFPDNAFKIKAVNWHTRGHLKHWWSLYRNAYKIIINSKVVSDTNPKQTYNHNKTLTTFYALNFSTGYWATNECYCYKDMIGKIKPDKNGIVHVKLFITVKRQGFDTNKPETVYLDIKNKKTAKIVWLSENNWHSEYRKFNKNIGYLLYDDDSNETKK